MRDISQNNTHTHKPLKHRNGARKLLLNILMFLPMIFLSLSWITFINQHNIVFNSRNNGEKDFRSFFQEVDGKKQVYEVLSADNHVIYVYEFSGESKDNDIIFFHGAIMDPKVHCKNSYKLSQITKCNVITFCYRGFDRSESISTEIGLMIDAFAIKLFCNTRKTKKYIFGQSLGCSLALYFSTLLENSKKILLILENPFYSGKTFIMKKCPIYYGYLIIADYCNDKRIKYLSKKDVKMLFILAEKENVINEEDPFNLKKLVEEKCDVKIVKGSDHLTMGKYMDYYNFTKDFIEKNNPSLD